MTIYNVDSVIIPCEHKFNFLGKRKIYSENNIIKICDVFYCEKCLKYEYKSI